MTTGPLEQASSLTERRGGAALHDARAHEAEAVQRASVVECASPLALGSSVPALPPEPAGLLRGPWGVGLRPGDIQIFSSCRRAGARRSSIGPVFVLRQGHDEATLPPACPVV